MTGAHMLVEFNLTMTDLMVDARCYDQLIITWREDLETDEILKLSHAWIAEKNFLTTRMEGLDRVGESSLTIEPAEPCPPADVSGCMQW